MTTLSVQVDGKLVRQGLQDLEAELPRIGANDIYQAMRWAQEIMQTPAEPPDYPIQWTSEKQRRYVLAMLRERGNLPYMRTGRYELGWKVRRNRQPVRALAGYSLLNEWDATQYVGGNAYGEHQQPMHQDRWPQLRGTVEKAIERLPDEVEEHIYIYARRNGMAR